MSTNETFEITFNGEPRQIEATDTIADLLKTFEIDPRRVAVEVNLELAPREEHSQRTLQPGDRLEVVTLFGGG